MPRLNISRHTDIYVSLFTASHSYNMRIGRKGHRLFSERYAGTRGIPKRWHYFFGKRISLMRRDLRQNGRDS